MVMTKAAEEEYKISLPVAILININIMLGAGLFINTSTLAQNAGLFGGFLYILVGLLMLPLILSIAELLRRHPAGGFYTFAQKELNPLMGFISGWCYFTAKIASCILMIHVSSTLLLHSFPALSPLHPYVLDAFFVTLFTTLNLLNIKAGSTIQKAFIGFKTFPILFAILSGAFLLQGDNFSSSKIVWNGLQSSLPLVIYAVVGFEASCSMSSKIRDSKKNAPLAVLISFGIVILIATLYQSIFFGALGHELTLCQGHCDTFPTLLHHLFGDTPFAHKFEGIIHLAIASSTLGAAYGIIFSNSWNLHILAQHNHIWFSKYFARLNANAIPYACVIVEGLLALVYLLVSQGVLVPLQQIGAFGCVIAYTLSISALNRAIKQESPLRRLIPLLGFGSCAILTLACLRSFFLNGMSSLLVYTVLFFIGLIMFQMKSAVSPKGVADHH